MRMQASKNLAVRGERLAQVVKHHRQRKRKKRKGTLGTNESKHMSDNLRNTDHTLLEQARLALKGHKGQSSIFTLRD